MSQVQPLQGRGPLVEGGKPVHRSITHDWPERAEEGRAEAIRPRAARRAHLPQRRFDLRGRERSFQGLKVGHPGKQACRVVGEGDRHGIPQQRRVVVVQCLFLGCVGGDGNTIHMEHLDFVGAEASRSRRVIERRVLVAQLARLD